MAKDVSISHVQSTPGGMEHNVFAPIQETDVCPGSSSMEKNASISKTNVLEEQGGTENRVLLSIVTVPMVSTWREPNANHSHKDASHPQSGMAADASPTESVHTEQSRKTQVVNHTLHAQMAKVGIQVYSNALALREQDGTAKNALCVREDKSGMLSMVVLVQKDISWLGQDARNPQHRCVNWSPTPIGTHPDNCVFVRLDSRLWDISVCAKVFHSTVIVTVALTDPTQNTSMESADAIKDTLSLEVNVYQIQMMEITSPATVMSEHSLTPNRRNAYRVQMDAWSAEIATHARDAHPISTWTFPLNSVWKDAVMEKDIFWNVTMETTPTVTDVRHPARSRMDTLAEEGLPHLQTTVLFTIPHKSLSS